jgi:hypothetical protein
MVVGSTRELAGGSEGARELRKKKNVRRQDQGNEE